MGKAYHWAKPYYRFEFSFREIRNSEILVEPGKKLNNCFIMLAEMHSIVEMRKCTRLFLLNNFHAFNPFSTNVPLIYPLITSENQLFYQFSDVFSGYRSGTSVDNELICVT